MYSKYLGRAVFLLVLLPTMLTAQRAPANAVPLKNWAAPLYWQPNQAEREAAGGALPQLQFSANAVSTNALTFVAITPCRLVDTRGVSAGFNGVSPFNGPFIGASGTLTIPVQSSAQTSTTAPAPCGAIPSIAQAYSLNLTVVPHPSGMVDYVSLWPSGSAQPFVSTLDDPQGMIIANAAIVPAGTNFGGISVFNSGPAATDVVIDMNGYFTAPTDLNANTALGMGSLASDTNGGANTAVGFNALQSNTTGGANTAIGYNTLVNNTNGASNTAFGSSTLVNNTTGGANTASGTGALEFNTTGIENTATGAEALLNNVTGSNNIAIGYLAGDLAGTANSNNIHIGNQGASGDGAGANSGVIRIGTAGAQTSFFAAGITGVNVSGVPVVVNSSGQLGVATSSRRFKEDIQDMGDASSGLLRLRPVTFRYKEPFSDGSKPVEYGLIAEEVDKVYPDLVEHSADGQIETVKYQVLDSMLLNEVQKQAEQNRRQSELIQQQAAQIRSLQAQAAEIQTQSETIKALEARLAALEAEQ
jgi:hypothetical protein